MSNGRYTRSAGTARSGSSGCSCGCECANAAYSNANYTSGASYRTRTASAYQSDCGCDDVLPVMAFVPVQTWGERYPELVALQKGTLFVALDKPYYGKGGCACG